MKKLKTAVLISGSGTNLQALLDACRRPGFPAEITLVISNRADAYGLTRAANAGVATQLISHKDYPDRETFDSALYDALVASGVEIVCLAGFMRLLTAGFVAKWQGRMINIHPSLLPAYKGLNTHRRVLEAGEKETGCTVHFVTAEMDDGEVILQAHVPILPDDSEQTLAARVLEQEHKIYPQALKIVAERLNSAN